MRKLRSAGFGARCLATVFALLMLVGAAGFAHAEEKIILRVATWEPPPQAADRAGIALFERDHPNVEVHLEVTPFDSYPQTMLVDIVAGTAPDVFRLSWAWIGSFVKEGVLADLRPILEAMDLPDYVTSLDEYAPTWLEVVTYDGKLRGLPHRALGPSIIYNKAMFDAAGVPYPSEDWTWEDMKEAARKLTIPGEQWGIAISTTPWYHESYILGNGGRFVGEDGRATGNLDDPKTLEAIQYLVDFFLEGLAPSPLTLSSAGGSLPLFFSNKVAMIVEAETWILEQARAQGLDVEQLFGRAMAPAPQKYTLAVHSFCVPVNAKNVELSAKLAAYMASSEAVTDVIIGQYKTVPLIEAQQLQGERMPAMKQEYEVHKNAVGRFFAMEPFVDGPAFEDVYSNAFELAIEGLATVEEAFSQAAKEYDQWVFGQ